MTYYTREKWGARPRKPGPGNLIPSNVEGLALHWPGITKPISGFTNVASALRGWQNYHMDTKGWSDIAYQMAVDSDGNLYELRGLLHQSGANGDTDVNERYGAVLLILAPGEKPSDAMVAEVRQVIDNFRAAFHGGTKIVGHQQIRPDPTTCPGPIVMDYIQRGIFEPAKAPPAPPAPTPAPKPSRGGHVDAAIASLESARGKGQRAKLIAAALVSLKQIPIVGGKK